MAGLVEEDGDELEGREHERPPQLQGAKAKKKIRNSPEPQQIIAYRENNWPAGGLTARMTTVETPTAAMKTTWLCWQQPCSSQLMLAGFTILEEAQICPHPPTPEGEETGESTRKLASVWNWVNRNVRAQSPRGGESGRRREGRPPGSGVFARFGPERSVFWLVQLLPARWLLRRLWRTGREDYCWVSVVAHAIIVLNYSGNPSDLQNGCPFFH